MAVGPTGGAGPRRLRASDRDREDAVAALRRATSEGYLTLLEFEERLDAAFAARYVDELGPLLADLPPGRRPGPARPPTGVGAPRRVDWPAGIPRRVLPSALAVLGVLMVLAVIANLWVPIMIFGFIWFKRNRGHCGWTGGRHRLDYI